MTVQTPTPIKPPANGSSAFSASQNSGSSGAPGVQLQPKITTITDTSLSSQPDIVASLNSVMSSLFGRLATPDEIAKYGSELNAYQRAHPTHGTDRMKYDESTWRPLQGTNTMTSTSVSPDAFFASLLQGSAEASQYRVMNGYLGALQQLSDSSKVG
jgi:hypothetical protein